MLELLLDPKAIGDERRDQECTAADVKQLLEITENANEMVAPSLWMWDPKPGTRQHQFLDERMKYWQTQQIQFEILQRCRKCQCSDILMGHERGSTLCRDCMQLKHSKPSVQEKVQKAWNTVKPPTSFPKRVDQGHEQEDLPNLTTAEKSVIAPVIPVVTVTKNYYAQKKLRQESITLTQDPDHTWACVLPRTELKSSHVMIERTARDKTKKYLIANRERVALWLQKLFRDHDGIRQMKNDGKLAVSAQALNELEQGLIDLAFKFYTVVL